MGDILAVGTVMNSCSRYESAMALRQHFLPGSNRNAFKQLGLGIRVVFSEIMCLGQGIEINHDHIHKFKKTGDFGHELHRLISDATMGNKFAIGRLYTDYGITYLGTRHHSDSYKLTMGDYIIASEGGN